MIITIDGPTATGKSTVAKRLAEELGYIYFDTGAMYRGLTWLALKENVDVNSPEEIDRLLDEFVFEIKIKYGRRLYLVNKTDVTDAIRQADVTALVSKVSANPAVRKKLVFLQRNFAIGVNAIFEGRDMGTVVFPEAQLKIFILARPEIRAERRYAELKAKFPKEFETLTLEKTLEEINERDNFDMTREISPLKQAEDAYLIETSDLSLDEVVMKVLELKDAVKT